MRIRIQLNEHYSQKMLSDIAFQANLDLRRNSDGYISEIWIENSVINNDEQTFKTLAMEMVKQHFCRIYSEAISNVEVTFVRGVIPYNLIRKGVQEHLREIVSIVEFQV